MRGLGSGHVTCGPMRGLEMNFTGRGQTDTQTDGHVDSLTESKSASLCWSNYLKLILISTLIVHVGCTGSFIDAVVLPAFLNYAVMPALLDGSHSCSTLQSRHS